MSLIAFAGSAPYRPLANLEVPGDIRALRFDDAGKRVAVIAVPGNGEASVLVLDVEAPARGWRSWFTGRRCGGLAWSPDGSLLAAEVDETLCVASAEQTGQPLTKLPGPASSLAWLGQDEIALAFPIFSPPGVVFGAEGKALRTLEPPPRFVSTHAPKVAAAIAGRRVALSHVWESVVVFEENGGTQELSAEPRSGDEPRSALTHRLELSADGTMVATMAQPSAGDISTDIWVGTIASGTLQRTLRLPPAAVVALAPELNRCWAFPLTGVAVELWTEHGCQRSIGTANDRLWGLIVAGNRICVWSRRFISVYESAISPWAT